MTTLLTLLNADLAAVAARVLPGMVAVCHGPQRVGAGTVWHAGGLILTNAHVVDHRVDGSSLHVTTWEGRTAAAHVLAVDRTQDLAALRVDLTGLTTIALGDSRRLRPGDLVLAYGYPLGVAGGATAGNVISTGRQLADFSPGDREWIAASLRLRPGHSGGPMVNAHGRLIGINTLMNGPQVGAGVPVHVVVDFLKARVSASGRRKLDA